GAMLLEERDRVREALRDQVLERRWDHRTYPFHTAALHCANTRGGGHPSLRDMKAQMRSNTGHFCSQKPNGLSFEPSSSGAATYLLSGKPAPDGLGRCLGAGGDAELIENMLYPALDARLAPSQLDADLVIAGPGGHSAQDLNVLLAQAYLLLDLRCAQL